MRPNQKLNNFMNSMYKDYINLFGIPPEKRSFEDSALQETMLRSNIEVLQFGATAHEQEDVAKAIIIKETIEKWKPLINDGIQIGYKKNDKWEFKYINISQSDWKKIFKILRNLGVDFYNSPDSRMVKETLKLIQ